MSATLSNTEQLASWLGAAFKQSTFRPIPLDERVLVDGVLLDKEGEVVRRFPGRADPKTDPDHVVTLCRREDEGCLANDQVIIFCSSKRFCHNCALKVHENLGVPASSPEVEAKRLALVGKLAEKPSLGVDPILQETIPSGVAFHHAGLTDTERSAIEGAFREGSLSILAATSTLGAGVNLPAGRVIFRNLSMPGGGLKAASYRQMAGRAGRKGAGRARGEAVVIASNRTQAERAMELMKSGLAAVESAIAPAKDSGRAMALLVLEGVCGGVVKDEDDLDDYVANTLVWHQCGEGDEETGRRARDIILDYAWAALAMLVEHECIEVLSLTPPLQSSSTSTRVREGGWRGVRGSGRQGRGRGREVGERGVGQGAREGNKAGGKCTAEAVCGDRSNFLSRAYQARGMYEKLKREENIDGGMLQVKCGGELSLYKDKGNGLRQVSRQGQQGQGREVERPVVMTTAQGLNRGGGEGGDGLRSTKLGQAVYRSSLGPADGLAMFEDLSEAAKGLVLRHTLHLSYLLTPPTTPPGLKPDWEQLYKMYSRAVEAAQRDPSGPGADLIAVFNRIGISEASLHSWSLRPPSCSTYVGRGGWNLVSTAVVEAAGTARRTGLRIGDVAASSLCERRTLNPAQKAVRLVAAMALRDLGNGMTARQASVSAVYGMTRGEVQGIQQSAATFAGMVTSFVKELGWTMFLGVVKGYAPAHSLGVGPKLLPLMQVPGMLKREAEALYESGIVNLMGLLGATVETVARTLRLKARFQVREGGGKRQDGTGEGGLAAHGASESIHFWRRAHNLKEAARECSAKRDKERMTRTSRLLRAFNGVLCS
ncbi:unnamed protein product, partial [Choristocarpus tenellus]